MVCKLVVLAQSEAVFLSCTFLNRIPSTPTSLPIWTSPSALTETARVFCLRQSNCSGCTALLLTGLLAILSPYKTATSSFVINSHNTGYICVINKHICSPGVNHRDITCVSRCYGGFVRTRNMQRRTIEPTEGPCLLWYLFTLSPAVIWHCLTRKLWHFPWELYTVCIRNDPLCLNQ